MANKTYHLTINNYPLDLTLTPPNKRRGYCWTCWQEKEIKVISGRPDGLSWEERKFCHSCALINLEKLAEHDFENKAKVIKELRQALEKNKSAIELNNREQP